MSLKRRIFLAVAFGILCILVVSVVSLYQDVHKRIHAFLVEDKIHDAFSPVVIALIDYQKDHGSPASDLQQLVPKYLSQIPTSPLVDSIDYSVTDGGKVWQLSLHSRALPQSRVYCSRSDDEFTPEEEQRVVLRYHAMWTVLKE